MIDNFYKLLMKFGAARWKSNDLTIFDVSGYPHYENVCSNILSHYLNPYNDHGLDDLVLSSLLRLAWSGYIKPRSIDISREYSTSTNKRIDILIQADNFVACIENKIFHELNNDFDDYRSTTEALSLPGNKTPITIILTLKPLSNASIFGFVNITYTSLWKEVRAKIGSYSTARHTKWNIYLYDFMSATESLAGGSMDLTEEDRFFIENDEIAEQFAEARKTFLNKLTKQLSLFRDIINSSNNQPLAAFKQWIYQSNCLVHDCIVHGMNISLDLYVSPKGWELQLFGRDNPAVSYLAGLVNNLDPIMHMTTDNRFVLKKWELGTDHDTIKAELLEWMTWLIDSDSASSNQAAISVK
ncbi:PD-(D/E)XK nuclease family protein [Desulfovibrio sp. TomC]|uniref:PD-(D/E)XK nuclease family protein n=1 Tax=Desulfovibrio sp. TomC TaxID=1562888 RepID=UPI0005B9E780|nr:PD-(D/E)XK nuclease family protein [Desulfovibrio sp. TomC]